MKWAKGKPLSIWAFKTVARAFPSSAAQVIHGSHRSLASSSARGALEEDWCASASAQDSGCAIVAHGNTQVPRTILVEKRLTVCGTLSKKAPTLGNHFPLLRKRDLHMSSKYALFTSYGDTAVLPNSTRTLNVHVPITLSDSSQATPTVTHPDPNSTSYTYAPGSIRTTTVTFDFRVPFHPARIAYPHQTITVDGQSITLDRVDISPSEARVYLHGGPKVPGSPTKLQVDNTSIGQDSGWQPSTRYTSDADFSYDISLYDQQGQWTFTITPPGPNGGKLTYTFHFVVPAQA